MNSIKVNSEGINKATKGRVNIAKQYMNSYVTCKLSNYGSLFPHTRGLARVKEKLFKSISLAPCSLKSLSSSRLCDEEADKTSFNRDTNSSLSDLKRGDLFDAAGDA